MELNKWTRPTNIFKVRWEAGSNDCDGEEPVETFLPSFNKVPQEYLRKHDLTQAINHLAHPAGPPSRECRGREQNSMRVMLLCGKGRKEREAVGDNTKGLYARRAHRLQTSPAEQGSGYRRFTPPSTSLTACLRILGVVWDGI